MAFLTQSRFPFLWKVFQYTVGGTIDKQKLYRSMVREPKSLLEVGCSVGNTAPIFIDMPGVQYVGIDVDPAVIEHAQRTFRGVANATFVCDDLRAYAADEQNAAKFDHILFAGMCHHIDDELCLDLIRSAQKLLTQDGVVIILDPLRPRTEDTWMLRTYMRWLEQGQFLRADEEMLSLIERMPEYRLESNATQFVGAMPNSWFKVARFGMYVCRNRIA